MADGEPFVTGPFTQVLPTGRGSRQGARAGGDLVLSDSTEFEVGVIFVLP